MTDFTSDYVPEAPSRPEDFRAKSVPPPPRREFYAYFTLIFLATLPLTIVTWTLSALRRFRMPEKDPFSKAWSQARIITPMIFHG